MEAVEPLFEASAKFTRNELKMIRDLTAGMAYNEEVDWIDDGEGIQELETIIDKIDAGKNTFSGEDLEILNMVFGWANEAREYEYAQDDPAWNRAFVRLWNKIARARGIDVDDSDFEDIEFDT